MEVTEQPLTLIADKSQREIALLAPGVRVTMTGAEALALWTELGGMLKALYTTRPDSSAAVPGALRERSSTPSALILPKQVAVDRLIRGMIAYAQRPDAEKESSHNPSESAIRARGVAMPST
jgi:hypothetical protein